MPLFASCQKPECRLTVAATQPSDSIAGTPFDPTRPIRYVLYPGDLLQIRYPTEPSLDQQVRIRSDGMVSLPYTGDVVAAYRSPSELADDLNKRYKDLLKQAEVTVIVVEESGRRIYLGGEVRAPGSLPLNPDQTLAQALFEAGWITPQAHTEGVLVLRARPEEGTYVLQIDLNRILTGDFPDVRLEPCDIIYVPETTIARVDRFVDQYVNMVVPRFVSFPFTTQLKNQPIHVINSGNVRSFPPVQIGP